MTANVFINTTVIYWPQLNNIMQMYQMKVYIMDESDRIVEPDLTTDTWGQ